MTVKGVRCMKTGDNLKGYTLFEEYYLDYWYSGCTPAYGYPQEYFESAYKGEGWYCSARGMNGMAGPFQHGTEALEAIIKNCPSKEMIIVSSLDGNNIYYKDKIK